LPAAGGWAVGPLLVIIALPMLIPWNVVGTIWQIFSRADIGLFGAALDRVGPALQRHAGCHLGVVHDRRHRRLALDAARHSADLCRPAGHSRRLLSSGAHRCGEPLGDIHQYRAAEAAEGSRHRRSCCASCRHS
jgi:hypothetical protein